MKPKYTFELNETLPRFERSVSWLCWAYNEEQLIGDYLVRANEMLRKTVEDYEIIVVDDCSTDRTNEIVRAIAAEIPEIRLLRNDRNRNVGYSSQRAIKSAAKEYLLWQTIDWSYDISMLRVFLELLKEYDVVAGVRLRPVDEANRRWAPLLFFVNLFGIKHVTRRSDTVRKAFVSIINYLLIRTLFRVPLSDFQNVVFYPTRLIQSIDYESNSSFANPEGLIKSYWRGASIVEVPISFIPRKAGTAKGTRAGAIARSVVDIFRLWFRWCALGRCVKSGGGSVKRLVPDEWEVA